MRTPRTVYASRIWTDLTKTCLHSRGAEGERGSGCGRSRRPSRPHVRLRTGRPVSQYAGIEGCTGWPVPSLMHRRRVLGDRIRYVGLDVHKEGIVVAVAEGGLRGEVRTMAGSPTRRRRCGGWLTSSARTG